MTSQHRCERHSINRQLRVLRVALLIEARSIPEPNTGCWLWTSYRSGNGYGRVSVGGKMCQAHRVSWEAHKGAIPAGLCVLHRCDTRSCVNPDHLFLGTHNDNMTDMVRKGRSVRPDSAGEAHGRAKLNYASVAAIRADNRLQRVIAAEYGVSRAQISMIRLGKNWRSAA